MKNRIWFSLFFSPTFFCPLTETILLTDSGLPGLCTRGLRLRLWLRLRLRLVNVSARAARSFDRFDVFGRDIHCRARHPSVLAEVFHVRVDRIHVRRQLPAVLLLIDVHEAFEVADDLAV